MKFCVKIFGLTLVGYAHMTFALNPVNGFYGGIFLGGSYSPKMSFSTYLDPTTLYITSTPQNGTITYSGVGNIGIELGYRMNQFRVEGELLYNSSPVNSIKIDSYSVVSRKKSTGPGFKGSTNTGAFMVNGFYDAFCLFDQSDFVPYVGVGIGYAEVANTFKFYYNSVQLGSLTSKKGAGAGQLIIGINYFMDDFTTIGIDFRGLETQKLKNNHVKGYELRRIGDTAKTFHDAFDVNSSVFTSNAFSMKSFSFNIIFNGTFDLGA